jgi:hypothetical protein
VSRWRVFVPGTAARLDPAALANLGRALFDEEVSVVSDAVDGAFSLSVLRAPSRTPAAAAPPSRPAPALVVIHGERLALSEASEDVALAHEAVRAMGGAGMDVLLARARSVWRWNARPPGDLSREDPEGHGYARAASIVAGVLAQHVLGPALLPDASRLVGIRGVRAWLEGPRASR